MESINQSINQSIKREDFREENAPSSSPLLARISFCFERERERKKRERKRERESASVVCVKGVEKMAPFFPMENVEGKSLSSYHSGRAQTHKSSTLFVVKTSIHPRDRQTDRRRRRRGRRRRFFLCRVRRVKIPFYHYTHTHHHGEENEEDVSSRVLLRHAHAATKLGHSLSFCRIIIA